MPESFYSLIGLATLACVSALLAELWAVGGWARFLFVLILWTFPVFLGSFSFFPLRYAAQLVIGFGANFDLHKWRRRI
jgi:hypothetical protein